MPVVRLQRAAGGRDVDVMEGQEYKDEGCHLAPSCLNCPFPACYLDKKMRKNRKDDTGRAEVLRTMHLTHEKAAVELGVSLRTVYRLRLREGR